MKVLVLLLLVAVALAMPEEYDCPANSHYEECGTACPTSCDNYKDPPFCIRMCNPGCHCDKGYVRVKEDVEECIKPKQCPKEEEEQDAMVMNPVFGKGGWILCNGWIRGSSGQ
ncbi:unnamed protein product [Larinioides sclopetarius]|uniref:TIL domain-containing protein n=1 Tax=Larinioides sclopetarius TaxID=280406 RepID=A0AAV2BSI6_9ARAC